MEGDLRRAGCYCGGEMEIELEVLGLAFQGVNLGLAGKTKVPCPWCSPRPYVEEPKFDVLAKACYERFKSP